MAQVLIRGLDDRVVERMKERARGKGRSLEAELRALIEHASRVDTGMEDARELAARLRRRLAGRKHTDGAE